MVVSFFSGSLINALKVSWLTDIYTNDTGITQRLSAANTDIAQIIKGLRLSNPQNYKTVVSECESN